MSDSTETEEFRKMFLAAFAKKTTDSTDGAEADKVGEMLIGKGEINWIKSAVNGTAYTVFFLVIFKLFGMIEGLQATINENNKANLQVIQRTVEAQVDLKNSINMLTNSIKENRR